MCFVLACFLYEWSLVESMNDGRGVCAYADPLAIFQYPCIDEALAPSVCLTVVESFGAENVCGDSGGAVNVHTH